MSTTSPKKAASSVPIINGYESLKEIGRGGFSRVYQAIHTKLDRPVAIKVLDIGMADEHDRRRFEREIETMVRVSAHANIVTILDTAFTQNGRPCIVMQLYSGGSLADQISADGTVSSLEALDIGCDIASALEASHRQGVLHCDLKPHNILISEFHQPALGDFGISTLAEERTRTGVGQGFTLHYAAPEVIEGGSQTAMSDVYSLAATIYTAVAGHRPFAPEGDKPPPKELARRILLTESPRLELAGVPVEIDRVLRKAMAKEPSERPQSAAEFSAELKSVLTQLASGQNSMPADSTTTSAPATQPVRPLTKNAMGARISEPAPTVIDDDRSSTAIHDPTEADAATGPRKAMSLLLVAAALVGIVVVVTRLGPTNTAPPVTEPAPEPSPMAFAPARPSNVDISLSPGSETEVVVTWTSPETDVEFVITSVDGSNRIETPDHQATITIDEGHTPCVQIYAVRGHLASGLTTTECLNRRN